MRRPPRDPRERLLPLSTVLRAVVQGSVALTVAGLVIAYALAGGSDDGRLRAVGFATIVLTNLGLILAQRSAAGTPGVRNVALVWVLIGAVAGLVAGLAIPALRGPLRFSPLSAGDAATVLAAALLALLTFEALRRVARGG